MAKAKSLDLEIEKWSWGGFALEWVYLSEMRYKWWWIFFAIEIALGFSKASWVVFAYIALAVYLGFNGRKLAWRGRKWKNADEFVEVQKTWDLYGKIATGLVVLAVVILSFVIVLQ